MWNNLDAGSLGQIRPEIVILILKKRPLLLSFPSHGHLSMELERLSIFALEQVCVKDANDIWGKSGKEVIFQLSVG